MPPGRRKPGRPKTTWRKIVMTALVGRGSGRSKRQDPVEERCSLISHWGRRGCISVENLKCQIVNTTKMPGSRPQSVTKAKLLQNSSNKNKLPFLPAVSFLMLATNVLIRRHTAFEMPLPTSLPSCSVINDLFADRQFSRLRMCEQGYVGNIPFKM